MKDQNELSNGIYYVGLGWQDEEIDLDISAFLLNANGRVRSEEDFVFYSAPKTPDGCVTHSLPLTGEYDKKRVYVTLNPIPDDVHKIVFAVTIDHPGITFGHVSSSFVRIVDAVRENELGRFDLQEDCGDVTAFVFCELYRKANAWAVKILGHSHQCKLSDMAAGYGVNILPHRFTKMDEQRQQEEKEWKRKQAEQERIENEKRRKQEAEEQQRIEAERRQAEQERIENEQRRKQEAEEQQRIEAERRRTEQERLENERQKQPAPESPKFVFWCPHCGTRLNAKEKYIGRSHACPQCQKQVLIQRNEPPVQPSPPPKVEPQYAVEDVKPLPQSQSASEPQEQTEYSIHDLIHAVLDEDKKLIQKIVAAGVDINTMINFFDGDTVLHLAVIGDCKKSVKFLLKLGADPYIQNLRGETPADKMLLPDECKEIARLLPPPTRANHTQSAPQPSQNTQPQPQPENAALGCGCLILIIIFVILCLAIWH